MAKEVSAQAADHQGRQEGPPRRRGGGQAVHNNVNVKLSPAVSYTQDVILRAAYNLSM